MLTAFHTDLYELTMMVGYWSAGLTQPATFELFVRRLPEERSYLIAAGLEPALEFLEQVRFTTDERDWLKRSPQFAHVPADFFDGYLANFAFTGDVWAFEEGTAAFANEPIVRVTAPLPEAQLVETALLATIGFQTSVATKAARVVSAAQGRSVIEFGARRAHGLGAADQATRAAFIGGCDGTSLVEAGRRYAIPTSGTMAHSWVEAFTTESQAFEAFGRLFGDSAVYLLDTYDTLRAAQGLAKSGLQPSGVRLDSGDLASLSRQVRQILDAHGLEETKILATGDLDEHRIAALVSRGVPIDGFGVGTALTTVSDAPALGVVYKLVEIERQGQRVGVVKHSPDKQTWPLRKQVWRTESGGQFVSDLIAADDEAGPPGAQPLLLRVMVGGRRTSPPVPLAVSRSRCRLSIERLPAAVKRLNDPDDYSVIVSAALESRRA
jgi:nicotinate phosphoribosyltransferase